jgi:hypothetical protein
MLLLKALYPIAERSIFRMVFLEVAVREQIAPVIHYEQEFTEAGDVAAFGGKDACMQDLVQIAD